MAEQTQTIRHRYEPLTEPTDDYDPSLPYGGRVYLARRKKPDSYKIRILEGCLLLVTFLFSLYAYFYFDHLHFNVTKGYAHLGYASAQHQIGQRYLHGKGVEKHPHTAMEWFKKAADQGHPHASYNLAVGHLQHVRRDLVEEGETHKLIRHAAENGVEEAGRALVNICDRGGCE